MIAWVDGIPLAHAGHWIASLLYVAPVALIVGALLWQSWREKRRKGEEPPRSRPERG
jgi:predicted MFS family arabinose efflux permease